jgi:hypothetical protein
VTLNGEVKDQKSASTAKFVPKYMKLKGKPIDYVAIDESQLSKEDLKSLKFSM